jgi:hypothetical protein
MAEIECGSGCNAPKLRGRIETKHAATRELGSSSCNVSKLEAGLKPLRQEIGFPLR